MFGGIVAMERKWWTLLAACVATFMLLLDITVVNVALPDIQRDLDASLSSLQWVVDAYAPHRRVPAHDWIARRPPRAAAGVQHRVRGLHHGVAAVRDLGDATLLNLARGLQDRRRGDSPLTRWR